MDVQCRLTAEDVQQRLLTAEAGHLLIVPGGQAVDSVAAADRLVGLAEADMLPVDPVAVAPRVVAAVTPQVVAAEDIAVAAVRTAAVTNSYLSLATYAVFRDGVFISLQTQVLEVTFLSFC